MCLLNIKSHAGSEERLVCSSFASHFRTALLLVLMSTLMGGCAAPPKHYLADTGLPARCRDIHRAGLLPPQIAVYEEQVGKIIFLESQSREAGMAVTSVVSEMSNTLPIPTIQLSGDDPEGQNILDLFVAVEVGMRGPVPKGSLRYRKLSDYSVGPVEAFMERNNVDALWVVTGRNLVSTAGRETLKALHNIVTMMALLTRPTGNLTDVHGFDTSIRAELRLALIDKRGSIIYYGIANEETTTVFGSQGTESSTDPGMNQPATGEEASVKTAPGYNLTDTGTVKPLINALFADYRKAVAK
jgi:hypothetical protein